MHADATVREVMDREFLAASEGDDLAETVRLMLEERTAPAVVLRGAEPVGVLGDRDVMAHCLQADLEDTTVGDAMAESVPTTPTDAAVSTARQRLAGRDTPWLVVTDGAEPVGVLTAGDLLASKEREAPAGVGGTETAAQPSDPNGHPGEPGTEAATEDATMADNDGICERCGALSRDLSPFNGQLLCADCRDI